MKAKVHQFPGNARPLLDLPKDHAAPIVILPVVQIERNPDNYTCLELKPCRRRRLPKVIIPINPEGVA